MTSTKNFVRRNTFAAVAAMFVCAAMLPALLSRRANAAVQMTERQIKLSTSKVSATDVTHTVSFKVATTGAVQGIVVDYCTSPLVDTSCTAPTGLDTKAPTTLVLANQSGISGFSIVTGSSSSNKVVLTNGSGGSISAGTTVSFDLGSSGGTDGETNPSTNGSFYARIVTYATTAGATGYVSNAINTGGTAVDAGGVAMSTANQLTVNARVQEVLVFCVGTDDANAANDCSDISGTTVDLGVVQSGTPSISPVATTSGGNNKNGLAMIRTNAVNGVVVDYFAEAVTGDSGSTHMGALRVSGSTCTGDGTIATGSKTDQCFNSSGTTQAVFGTSDEGFGMTSSSVDTTNGTTTNLVRDTEYDGDGTNGAGNGWAWAQTTPDRLASSTASGVKVVDDEMLILRFAAQAAVTTPTGQYGVTSTYVATSSF